MSNHSYLLLRHADDDDEEPLSAAWQPAADWPKIARLEALLALLVTDLQGFTPLLERLGDCEAQRVIRAHNRMLRRCVAARGGAEVAHTGDGILAAFRSVTCALLCAAAMQRALERYSHSHPGAPLRARIGVHAGEPLPEDGRLFGACVVTAVRICAVTENGHVLVSDVVRQLAAGKPATFADRGIFPLKGLETPLRLHELLWCTPDSDR